MPSAPPKKVERAPRYSVVASPKLQLAVFSELPTEFATVSLHKSKALYVSWLNPEYEDYWLNLGAVMNRGAFSVQ